MEIQSQSTSRASILETSDGTFKAFIRNAYLDGVTANISADFGKLESAIDFLTKVGYGVGSILYIEPRERNLN